MEEKDLLSALSADCPRNALPGLTYELWRQRFKTITQSPLTRSFFELLGHVATPAIFFSFSDIRIRDINPYAVGM